MACKLSGISAILATFDEHRHYPEIGTDLRRLPVPDGETPGQSGIESLGCLLPIAAEARSMSKFLIIDTRTGFNIQDPMFEIFEYCGIPEATSTAALLPIQHNIPSYSAAVSLTSDFREIELLFTRSLFRSWAKGADSRPLPALQNFPAVPLWRPSELSKKALAMIHGGAPFVESEPSPPVPDLFGYVGDGQTSPFAKKDPRLEIELHLHAAKRAIFNAILAPISHST